MVCQIQKPIKIWFVVGKTLDLIEDPENDQLAAFRGDLKCITSLMSKHKFAFKMANFYFP